MNLSEAATTQPGFITAAGRCMLIACCLLPASGGAAQGRGSEPHGLGQASAHVAEAGETISVLLLSDIHFEPFFDPGKVSRLAAAPVREWKGILAAPASAEREQRFAALQQACHTRGDDTSYPLLESSLRAVQKEAAGARFVTLSGDLISHSFSCKYGAEFPHAASGDYRAFVEKTLAFVTDELGSALPGVPVYAALGNNDSDCGDYQLDAHSAFLATVGEQVTKGFPAPDRKSALETFADGGYYSVRLPVPLHNARLLVLDDLFMSTKYQTCSSKADASAADAQLRWLTQQLTEARRNKEHVWVMGHIPPGVDVHASATRLDEVCGEKGPRMFLSSERIADVLVEFSDVVKLGIFAHTHMDEMRILAAGNGAKDAESVEGVAVKMVSSISPINGNAPSFTVARIEPSTAALVDFRVFASSNQTGVDAAWREEYDWGKTYHQPEFSTSSVSKVIAGFEADASATTEASRAYISNFLVGTSPLLGLVWPQYVCSMRNDSAQGFKACICQAGK